MSKPASSDTPGRQPSRLPPLALIAGPTASGKSEAALTLAEGLAKRGQPAVIINADSAQAYADLLILSAAPDAAARARAPHRLYGAWDGAVSCSAADWAAAARIEIAAAHTQGIVPILVGGSGLYLRALIEGLAPIPPIDPAIRARVRALPVAEAYTALALADPLRAAALAPHDRARIARALEVVWGTGAPLEEWQARREGGIGAEVRLIPLVLMPPRDWLYPRCDARFAGMVAAGALDEVARLLARGLSLTLPVMRAIGVRAIAEHLAGTLTLAQAVAQGSQATRNYAKRQFTWARHQLPENWLRAAPNDVNIALERNIITIISG